MSKKVLILFLLCNCSYAFAQIKPVNVKNDLFQHDTIKKAYSIFDYFRQEYDSLIYNIGSVYLMSSDSLSFNGRNEYTLKVSNPANGRIEVYFKSKLLYKYMLIYNEINGVGFCYYPFTGNVALQGEFKHGKLDGLVFVQKEDGEMIEVMKFKEGKYIQHIYHWLCFSKKCLQIKSKNRTSNPLRNDEVIVR